MYMICKGILPLIHIKAFVAVSGAAFSKAGSQTATLDYAGPNSRMTDRSRQFETAGGTCARHFQTGCYGSPASIIGASFHVIK